MSRGDRSSARDQFAESVQLFDQVQAKYIHTFLALVGLSEAAARCAIALAESMVAPDSPSYLLGLSGMALGEAQLARNQREAALVTLRAALTRLESTLGPDHPSTVRARRLSQGAGR